ncbi:hypothetical protein [Paenibacillus sp. USHLN196]|uniref:hypothetical protein n=1 Tax=Paenibacillus sp. USHLN196 TaxID=3081291 RepID=UPI00301A6F70
MNIELLEVSTYEEAKYVVFSGENADRLNLTKDKVYQLHREECTNSVSEDYYIVNDNGQDSFTGLKCVSRRLYKT